MQEALAMIQNNAETIIALCALFVSITSIAIGFFELHSQQKHNRLSVRPIGKIGLRTVEDKIEIEIRNDGTGPMLCSNIKIYEYALDEMDNLRDAIPILQERPEWVEINTGTQFAIGAGERKILLRISADHVSPEYYRYCDRILDSLEKITMEIEYHDIYDQHIGTLRREKFGTGSFRFEALPIPADHHRTPTEGNLLHHKQID